MVFMLFMNSKTNPFSAIQSIYTVSTEWYNNETENWSHVLYIYFLNVLLWYDKCSYPKNSEILEK